MEHLALDLGGSKGFQVTHCHDCGHALPELADTVGIFDPDGVFLSIRHITRHHNDRIDPVHGGVDRLLGRLYVGGHSIDVRKIPALEHVTQLAGIDCREGDSLSLIICSGQQHLLVGIAENDHGGSVCTLIGGIVSRYLRIRSQQEGIVLLRGDNIVGSVHPVKELLIRVTVGDKHSLSHIVSVGRHIGLHGAVVHHVHGTVDRQTEQRTRIGPEDGHQVGIRRDRKGITLLITEHILKRCIRSVIPAHKGISLPGESGYGNTFAVVIEATTGQPADRPRSLFCARSQGNRPLLSLGIVCWVFPEQISLFPVCAHTLFLYSQFFRQLQLRDLGDRMTIGGDGLGVAGFRAVDLLIQAQRDGHLCTQILFAQVEDAAEDLAQLIAELSIAQAVPKRAAQLHFRSGRQVLIQEESVPARDAALEAAVAVGGEAQAAGGDIAVKADRQRCAPIVPGIGDMHMLMCLFPFFRGLLMDLLKLLFRSHSDPTGCFHLCRSQSLGGDPVFGIYFGLRRAVLLDKCQFFRVRSGSFRKCCHREKGEQHRYGQEPGKKSASSCVHGRSSCVSIYLCPLSLHACGFPSTLSLVGKPPQRRPSDHRQNRPRAAGRWNVSISRQPYSFCQSVFQK